RARARLRRSGAEEGQTREERCRQPQERNRPPRSHLSPPWFLPRACPRRVHLLLVPVQGAREGRCGLALPGLSGQLSCIASPSVVARFPESPREVLAFDCVAEPWPPRLHTRRGEEPFDG